MKRKHRSFIILLSLCGILTAGTALSYLTSHDNKSNAFKTQNNTIEIIEEFPEPDKVPTEFKKKVQIKNTGETDCYVRVSSDFSSNAIGELYTIDFNTTDWTTLQSDGYYYYKKKLAVGETTPALYTAYSLTDLDNADAVESFDIYITGESIESRDYVNYQEAWSEFEAQNTL